MKKLFLTFLIILSFGISSFADDAGVESHFSVGAGNRSLGMGGGYISIANDASATFYNPAGLAFVPHQEATFMYMDLFEGTSYQFAGWAYPDQKLGGFGISFLRIATDDITRTENYVVTGSFDYSYSQLLISYGKNLSQDLSVGLSLKILNQSIDSLSDYGVGFDLALMTKLSSYVSFGLIMRDMVPPELDLGNQTETNPVTIGFGTSFNYYPISKDIDLTASLDLVKTENRTFKVHSGGEILFDKKYALRAGYDNNDLSFGAGFVHNKIKFDYSYKVLDYIQDSHRFSMTLLIGSSVADKKAKEEDLLLQRSSDILQDEKTRQFNFYYEKGEHYQSLFLLDSALVAYQQALAFDEKNQELIGRIAGLSKSLEIQRQTELEIARRQEDINSSISAFYDQALNFYSKKYYSAAKDMLNLIFDIDPTHKESHGLLLEIDDALSTEIANKTEEATKAEASGDNLSALKAFNRILEIDPQNPVVKNGLERIAQKIDLARQLNNGIKLYDEHKYLEADRLFRQILSFDPENPVAREYLKKIDLTKDKPSTLEDLQKNKAIWQKYLDGLRFMRNNQYQKAIDAWNEVLKVFPNNVNTLNNIEQAKLRLKSE